MAFPKKFGAEFLVNSITEDWQHPSAMTGLADGRFVVIWSDESEIGGALAKSAIRAQIFNANGTASGGELLVGSSDVSSGYPVPSRPSITALEDGRFVVTWSVESAVSGDISGLAIQAQIFNGDGTVSGDVFLVNTSTTDNQLRPTVTVLTAGKFVIIWWDKSQSGDDTSSAAIRAQIFNADGSKAGAEFLVNSITVDDQQAPTITALGDGRFVVIWSNAIRSASSLSDIDIRAQVFKADGSRAGGEFQVNTTTAVDQVYSKITSLADGRFVVSWMDRSETGRDTSGYAIRAQIFDPREAAVMLTGPGLDDDFVGCGRTAVFPDGRQNGCSGRY